MKLKSNSNREPTVSSRVSPILTLPRVIKWTGTFLLLLVMFMENKVSSSTLFRAHNGSLTQYRNKSRNGSYFIRSSSSSESSSAIKTRRRVMKRSCYQDSGSVSLERDKAEMVLTGRVEGVMHFHSDGILSTGADTDIDGYELDRERKAGRSSTSIGSKTLNLPRNSKNYTTPFVIGELETNASTFSSNTRNNHTDGRNNNSREKYSSSGIGFLTERFAARVRVKRIIKGDRALENALIVIDGFGQLNQKFCTARVRVRDTRIFMLTLDNHSRIILAANPLPLTLDNLRELNSYPGK